MAACERANEEIERVTAAQAECANEEIERVLVGKTNARSDEALGSTFGDFKGCRPLASIVEEEEFENWAASRPPIGEMLARIERLAAFSQRVLPYFTDYLAHSFISAYSRAYLYAFVRALKPLSVAEVGTLFGGTTEVIARALFENGSGIVHTIDPFGALRAPPVIATWPKALRRITHFHPVNSMSFFGRSAEIGRRFDLVFVDGNHDLHRATACWIGDAASAIAADAGDSRSAGHTGTGGESQLDRPYTYLSEIFCSAGSQVSCCLCTKASTSSGVMACE